MNAQHLRFCIVILLYEFFDSLIDSETERDHFFRYADHLVRIRRSFLYSGYSGENEKITKYEHSGAANGDLTRITQFELILPFFRCQCHSKFEYNPIFPGESMPLCPQPISCVLSVTVYDINQACVNHTQSTAIYNIYNGGGSVNLHE